MGGRRQLTVLARDLHGAVGSADYFTHWLADKVDQCQLRSGIDYEGVFGEKLKNPLGGRPRREVAFSLNAAKEIGMAARGDYGKRLRRYFLDCEFRLLEGLPPPAAAQMRPAVAPGGHAGAGAGAVGGYVPVPVPLSMGDFLQVAGFDKAEADRLGGVYERLCRRELAARGRSLAVQRHPVSGVWLFEREALDRFEADRLGGVYERLCRRELAAGGRSLAVQRHPVSGVWLFEREALDAWWPSARQQAIISP